MSTETSSTVIERLLVSGNCTLPQFPGVPKSFAALLVTSFVETCLVIVGKFWGSQRKEKITLLTENSFQMFCMTRMTWSETLFNFEWSEALYWAV